MVAALRHESTVMTTIHRVIAKYPATAYFALTFAISWGGALLAIGGSGGMSGTAPTDDPRFVYALLAMLAGPSLSGILLTALVHGRNALPELLSRVLEWRVATRWYAVAILAAPFLWIATLFALSLTSPRFLPALLTSQDKASLVLVGLAVAVGAGVFEELGWTGFAIPQIRRRHGLFTTGLIVGVLWGAWHLLTNVLWAAPVSAGELPLSIFLPVSVLGTLAGYLAAFRVLMVWVYDRTRSVFVAILMHASITGSVLILDPAAISGTAALTYSFALAAAVWAAVAVVALANGWHRARRPARGERLAA